MVRVFSFARRNGDIGDAAAWLALNSEDRCAEQTAAEQEWPCKFVSSPQARPSLVDVVAGAGHGAAGMMPRGLPTRRGLQALALVIATAYATILLYQAVAPRQVIRTIAIILSLILFYDVYFARRASRYSLGERGYLDLSDMLLNVYAGCFKNTRQNKFLIRGDEKLLMPIRVHNFAVYF